MSIEKEIMSIAAVRQRKISPWPYLLIFPSILALILILGYPIVKLLNLSFQKYGLTQIIAGHGVGVGLKNFTDSLTDSNFWTILLRTYAFTFCIVFVTIIAGAAMAHLMLRMHNVIRILLTATFIMVWAMPQLVGISIWRWLFSFNFSIVTSTVRSLGFPITNHNYFQNIISGFTIIGGCVAWGALPFVTISIYAALTQVPKELIEAAELDGATRYQVFKNIIFPMLLPIYIILISLSVIWDFQIFSHIWVFLDARPAPQYFTMAIYAFEQSFGQSEYGKGAAISILMIIALLGFTGYYLKQMVKIGDGQ